MTRHNGTDPENTTEIATVDDPEQYIDRRRLKDIFDARRDLRETRREAAYQGGDDSRRAYRADVSSYVSEVEPLFLSTDLGHEYWNNVELGTAEIRPPHKSVQRGYQIETESGQRKTMDTPPKSHEVELVGVRSIFELPQPLEGEIQYVDSSGFGTNDLATLRFTREMPFQAVDNYARATNRFLAALGLELEPDTTDDKWTIEP